MCTNVPIACVQKQTMIVPCDWYRYVLQGAAAARLTLSTTKALIRQLERHY
jgi:uncharacterized membrane protein